MRALNFSGGGGGINLYLCKTLGICARVSMLVADCAVPEGYIR
jgi:hypothetical protein